MTDMIACSIIQKSQLEGAQRIDAEFYEPKYLRIKKLLDGLDAARLDEICEVTDGNHGTISQWYVDSGVRFLRGQDLTDFFISNSSPVFIDNKIYPELKRSHIHNGDVLVSIVGTVGLVSIVTDEFDQLTGNCKIAILHPNNVNSWFLSAFLAGRYGQDQIQRRVTGAVQTGIILKDLANISVPLLTSAQQQEIAALVQNSYKHQFNSESLYLQAENRLLEKLGMADFEVENELTYVVDYGDVREAKRMDAEYFQPRYLRLIEKLKQHITTRLGDLVKIIKGTEPGSDNYREKGIPFYRVSNLSKEGLIERDQKFLDESLYKKLKEDYEPKSNEVLLTKDATPGIAYVLKESPKGIIAGGILRLQIGGNIASEYLALCLNSLVGQLQVERAVVGSVIAHWRLSQIRNTIIPLLPRAAQQQIADLVQRSYAARSRSKELLEEAKRKVEEMIEVEAGKHD